MECNIRKVLFFALFVFLVKAEETKVRFVPSHYKLEIKTTEEHFKDSTRELTYTGKVTVDFKKEGALPEGKDFEIKLDANPKTTVQEVTLKGDGSDVVIKKKEIKEGKLVITAPAAASTKQQFTLTVKFTNLFGNDMTGFYRSSYTEKVDNKEETRWLLTTHFEPIYARDAFPCFDQPDLKATFDVEITVPKSVKTVLSNTPQVLSRTDTDANSETVVFKKTPFPMSTYLVAFTASNLKSTDEETFSNGQKLRTYGRPEIIKKGYGVIPQRVAKGALEKLGEYLGEKYSFGKVDQVGIPDFSAGAMENWGHISFREKSLFFDESSARNTIQSNTLTIIHELVHQWFGNLVTLESWDYIWLNEAFANYLEYVIGAELTDFKNWKLMEQLLVNEIHLRAFETDGLKSSKPLNYKIPNENLIVSSFNDIPYSKGAAVLRMWNFQLQEKFQQALKAYIKDRKEKNSNPTQLSAFLEAQGLEENVFKCWTDQAGYPVVDLIRINSTHYNITQTRFFWEKETGDKTVWRVPISFSTDKDKNFKPTVKRWLGAEPVPTKKVWNWVVVNNHQAGYYRVNYDKENWAALSEALTQSNFSDIPELNRAQIVNDIFSLARSLQKEYVDYSAALKLSKYLKNETSFIAWKTALSAFDFLRTKLYNDDKTYAKFQDHILSIATPHFKGLAPAGTLGHVDKLMNIEISRWLCSLGFKNCTDEATNLYKDGKYKEYPDTQEIILCTVVRNSSDNWGAVFKAYSEEKDSSVKLMYLSALGCSNNQTIMSGYLNKTLESNSGIRKQDLKYVLSSVYNGNLKNVEVALKFIENNFEKIAKEYGGLDPLGGALVGIAKKLKTKDQLKRMEELVGKIKKSPECSSSLDNADNAVNIAKSNINWVENRMKQVTTYFNSGSLLSYSFALLLLSLISVFQF